MGDETGLPVLSFDETSVPSDQRFELFHEATAPLFDTYPLGDSADCSCSATDYLVDDLVVSHLRYDPQTLRRTTTRTRNGTSEWIVLQVYRHGGLRGQVGEDQDLDFDAASVGMVDLTNTFTAWSDAVDVVWVGFPRARLLHGDEVTRCGARTWNATSERGRALAAAVTDLWARLADARAADAGDLAAEITATVDQALRPGDYTPTSDDLRRAIRAHIAANLDDLDLGVDSLRARFHCSRTSLYRLFESDGGVARHIRELRLQRCFEELTRPAQLPRRVAEIATRWGFENPSHFHRLFRRKYGLAPSALNPHPVGTDEDRGVRVHDHRVREFHEWAMA